MFNWVLVAVGYLVMIIAFIKYPQVFTKHMKSPYTVLVTLLILIGVFLSACYRVARLAGWI